MGRSDELIKTIHEKQLEMLRIFHNLCEQLGLKYTLSSGTLLGAVRHKGFIPWDDDIDVSMPREDYEILIKEANGLLPDGFFLQHYTTEKEHPWLFAKLRNSNTTWIEKGVEGININHGLGMDIFPIDRISAEKLDKVTKKSNHMYSLIHIKNAKDGKSFKKWYKRIVYDAMKCFRWLISTNKIIKNFDEFLKKNGYGELTTADILRRNKTMPYSFFDEYERIKFEGEYFWAIKNRLQYLEIVYGKDYMQLPPEEKRVIHIAEIIDLDKSYKYYTQKGKGEK